MQLPIKVFLSYFSDINTMLIVLLLKNNVNDSWVKSISVIFVKNLKKQEV